MKKCTGCNQIKNFNQFNLHRRCKDCISIYNKKYIKRLKRDTVKLKKNKEDRYQAVCKWEKNNSEKVKAKQIIRAKIISGQIKRLPCIRCGVPNSHGHHEDYTKPLEVMWLCAKHHIERHKLLNN